MTSIELGKRVLQIRGAAGLNQREFAARLGTSSGYISSVESGKTMPGGDFLLRLHQEFGTDVTWLLTGRNASGSVPTPTLAPDEAALLDNYRHSPKDQQDILKATSAAFAKSCPTPRRSA